MEKQPSEHASISFTAHYTGEMWQKLGLSHPALATKRGKQLHKLMYPIEWFANTFFGVTTNKTLTSRHHLIDQCAIKFIEKFPNTQVVEIAAGLSPRGWRFLQNHADISYAEIDLTAMSQLKQTKSQNLPAPTPSFHTIDIIKDDLSDFFNELDKNRPVLIITEGLINYFSLDVLAKLSQKLAKHLQAFSNTAWITENYPFSTNKNYNKLVKTASFALGKLTKSSFSFYFDKPASLIDFFQKNGFTKVDIYQPSQKNTPENSAHLGDTVWVVMLTT